MMHKTFMLLTFFSLLFSSMANTVNFDLPSFGESYMDKITLLGDSSQNNDGIMLTGDNPSAPQLNWNSGALVYKNAIPFSTAFSFSTSFSFSITSPDNPTSFGQGLAFFISPFGLSAGSANRFGLPNPYVAVVFDTRGGNDPTVTYPRNPRIIVLANQVEPLEERSLIDLTNGQLFTAWIDYNRGNLTVFLGHDRFKPDFFLLTVQIDVYSYLVNNTNVYIGFSALSVGRVERHFIQSWSFQSKNDSDSKNLSHKKLMIGGIVFVFVIVAFLIIIYLKVRTRTGTQYPLALQEDIELASRGHEQDIAQEGGQSETEITQEDDILPSSSQSVTTPNIHEAVEESTPESSDRRKSKRIKFLPKKLEDFVLFKPKGAR